MVYVLRMLGLFMVIPVLAVATLNFPDYSALWLGLAVGGYGLTQAILQIPMGVLSDRWGRKPVIYLGLLMFALGSLIAGLADTMWMLTLGRILQGSGAIAGAVMALASDNTRESQRTKVMAIIGISIACSFYIAILLGPLLAAKLGLDWIFFITSICALMSIPLIKFGVKNDKKTSLSSASLPKLAQLSSLVVNPHLWRLNVSVLVIHMLITCFFVQVPQLLLDIDLPLAGHWKVYGLVLLASIIGLIILMRVSKRVNISLSFRLALLCMAGGFFIFIVQDSTYLNILLAGILFFSGFNFLEAKMPAMISSIAPASSKGSAMGLYASHQFFGAFLGGLLAGTINNYFPSHYTFACCLVVIGVLSIIAKGLNSLEEIKTLSLSLSQYNKGNADKESLNKSCKAINELLGVKEVNADLKEQVIYVKANIKLFKLEDAQILLREQYS